MTSPESGKDVLARIKPTKREESTFICLRPDLLSQWERLNEELAEAATTTAGEERSVGTPAGRGGGKPAKKARDLAKRIQEVESEIEATQVRFTMRATDKWTWQEMANRYPPRDGFVIDQIQGYNVDEVLDAAIRECLIDPRFEECRTKGCEHEDCGTWEQLEKIAGPSEWQALRELVNTVNSAVSEPPKSELASQILRRRDSGSGQRVATE